MSTKSEAQIVHDVLETLGRRPDLCRIWRQNTGCLPDCFGRPVRFGLPGAGDISGILIDGRRLEIECKSAIGRQTEDQKAFQQMIRKFSGVYLLVRSAEDALQMVEEQVQDPTWQKEE